MFVRMMCMLRSLIHRYCRREHYEIALNLSNLAAVHAARGDLRAAELMYRQSLAMEEKTIGPDHPDTALTALNLGVLLSEEGRLTEAPVLCELALRSFEASLAPDHPRTAICRKECAEPHSPTS